MLLAITYIAVDPTWPWDSPFVGLPALAVVAIILVGMTIWTYLGAGKITRSRLLTVVALRLAALSVACLLVLRPSLAHQDEETITPSRLLILVDSSTSMNIEDEVPTMSRWQKARRILAAPDVAESLKNLAQDNKIDVVYYQGAEGVAPLGTGTEATGKRTDFGTWLHQLWRMHGRDGNLRGLLIFSDGANNGTRFDALQLAKNRWAGLHTFALGDPKTSFKQRDVALTSISPPLEPLPVKTQFTVSGKVDAWGFKDSPVDVSLWIEDPVKGTMVMAGAKERVLLKKLSGNDIALTRDVPSTAGEYKVTLKVDPLPGEVTDVNNEISSFITVTKEGLSILWVEGRKRLESAFILRYALAKERRFRLYPAEKLADKAASESDWFDFDKQHYDVIVIGDISARRFSSGNKEIFEKIRQMVAKGGTGLMLMGGHESFGNSDWQTYPDAVALTSLLPVRLNEPGQVVGPVRMLPRGQGHYLLRLADDPVKSREIWEKVFDPLDGMSRMGTPDPKASILAVQEGSDEPVLIESVAGKGRILLFAGDTTWKSWRRTPEMLPAYERFWKQAMLWLARQENLGGAAWVKLDARRLVVGTDHRLGFQVGLKGKGGVDIPLADFQVTVVGPGKDETGIVTRPEYDSQRGYFDKVNRPGEYRIKVQAKGKDPKDLVDGKPREIQGEASARFMIVTEELEDRPPVSDHEFLSKLARAGGGRHFSHTDEPSVLQLLGELKAHKLHQPHVDLWPDWRRNPPPPAPGQSTSVLDQLSTLWNTAALPCLLLFVAFLSLEWYLRRRWEMV